MWSGERHPAQQEPWEDLPSSRMESTGRFWAKVWQDLTVFPQAQSNSSIRQNYKKNTSESQACQFGEQLGIGLVGSLVNYPSRP